MSNLHRIELDLELLTDVCVSVSNRTLGQADTFHHIPGRSLWGAAASRAYRSGIAEEEAFRLFQQGAVRVLDAVPVDGGSRCYPIPRSWHQPKDAKGEKAHNFAQAAGQDALEGQQSKPLGEGWLTPKGTRVNVETTFSLRTSVDPTGRARKGLLFGLRAIRAGTRFWTALVGTNKEDVEKVAKWLTSEPLRIGRSRNAEFGRVKVTRHNAPAGSLPHGGKAGKDVSFFCVSRCILRDERTGSLTLIPSPQAFGLADGWTFDEARSFIRTARIVPFNSKRNRPEADRVAIERGSVITFTSASATADPASLQAHADHGIGEHRHEGYGEVLVAPAWLTDVEFAITKAAVESPRGSAKQPTGDALFDWAKQKGAARKAAADLYDKARTCAVELARKRLPPAQWGVLRRMAREARFSGGGAALAVSMKRYYEEGKRRLLPKDQKVLPAIQDALKGVQESQQPIFLELLASICMRPQEDGTSGREETR